MAVNLLGMALLLAASPVGAQQAVPGQATYPHAQANPTVSPAPAPYSTHAVMQASACPDGQMASPMPGPHGLHRIAPMPSGYVPTPSVPPAGPVYQTVFQTPTPPDPRGSGTDALDSQQIQLDLPGDESIFKRPLKSDEMVREQWRQERRGLKQIERITFPDEVVIQASPYVGRNWAPVQKLVEPNYVCHGRLFFEEKNAERYGWSLGVLQPFVSVAAFYADVVKLPYQWAVDPCRCHECNTGYCLPGDPVPYMLYPPGASLTGTVAEAGVVLALLAIFP